MKSLLLIIFLASLKLALSQNKIDNPDITKNELHEQISFLASDSLKGRKPGTPEDLIAAKYIADNFKKNGIKPIGDNYFQKFFVITETKASKNNYLKIENFNAELNKDFTPYSFSINSTLNSDVVFVGFGFDIDNEDITWNDYSNVDVKNKWVLVLRADPELENPDSKFIPYSNEKSKVITAKEKGAAGVLFVSGNELDKKDNLIKLKTDQTQANLGIPVIHIKRNIANKILETTKNNIEDLETAIINSKKPNSFDCKIKIDAKTEIEYNKIETQNIIGILESNNPNMKKEFIVIGGHYDHLGFGGFSSSSRMPDSIAVHFGADDNASGVASMLEIAEKLAAHKSDLKRSIIFIAFGAEEIGLIGSKYFTSSPLVDIKLIKAMVNIDMVGRLKPNNELSIGGLGTSSESEAIIDSLAKNQKLIISKSFDGFGPSDHTSFYIKNIPVFFFTTGAHEDYHTPLDVVEKINFDGLKLLSDYIYDLSFLLINKDKNLVFKESGKKEEMKSSRGGAVKLGIMPNFGKSDNNGLRVDAVKPDGAAFKGGMKKGDIITSVAGSKISNIYEYMAQMGKLKAGQTITVDVLRDGEKQILIIKLDD
ncbi:MAG: M20/M25/M40 family metallo-hydrolase [Bacteroidales bacterium]|nr:M20/M25/M40 family metallo-hydrolase [Bacteroidales bacterium]MBN2755912.1 M20/M25/M40 family metallo-hydrolase [Bacteroidales bacterium]